MRLRHIEIQWIIIMKIAGADIRSTRCIDECKFAIEWFDLPWKQLPFHKANKVNWSILRNVAVLETWPSGMTQKPHASTVYDSTTTIFVR